MIQEEMCTIQQMTFFVSVQIKFFEKVIVASLLVNSG